MDPVTWISAAGAAVFTINDFDQKTSDWARQHTPIFGSERNAETASDVLAGIVEGEALVTGALTPSGDELPEWALAKARGLGVEYGALVASSTLADTTKTAAGRMRPDGSDDRSFPSAHSAMTFARSRLSNRNLDSIEMPPWTRASLKTGNLVMASATAWARVEGGNHYPSDVLVGACLGNLVTVFIHDAFMNLPEKEGISFYIEPSPSHVFFGISFDF